MAIEEVCRIFQEHLRESIPHRLVAISKMEVVEQPWVEELYMPSIKAVTERDIEQTHILPKSEKGRSDQKHRERHSQIRRSVSQMVPRRRGDAAGDVIGWHKARKALESSQIGKLLSEGSRVWMWLCMGRHMLYR